MANLTGNINLVSSGVQYAIFLIGTAATFFFIDRTGRRPLLIYGALCMGTCLLIVGGILGGLGTPIPNGLNGNLSVKIQVTGSPAYAVIAFCYLLVLAYSITLAPVAWGKSFRVPFPSCLKNNPLTISFLQQSTQQKSGPSKPAQQAWPSPPSPTGSSTSPLVSSSLQPSKTSNGDSSLSSASSASALPPRHMSPIPRPRARPSKRSSFCSARYVYCFVP
jgi:hypothetical protein